MAQGVTGHKDFVCTPNSCTVRINYSETYDVATNKSTFTITSIQVRDTADYSSSYSRLNGKVLVNGAAVFSFNSDYGRVLLYPQNTFCTVVDDPEHGSYNPVTGSATIAHSSTDGTATATIALVGNGYNYFKCMTSVYYNWFDYASSATQSVTLTTISRASTMTAPNGTLGQSQTLEISSSSASFKHTIAWSCGSQSGSISAAAGVSSVAFTPPMALASENTTGTKVRINYTLTTLSGSTVVGTSTAHADYTIPSSVKPTVSSGWATIAPYNTVQGVPDGVYLQGYSRARVTFDTSKITYQYGATFDHFSVVNNGVEDITSPYQTKVLTSAGNQTVTAYVYDTRGRYASINFTVPVTAYTSPSMSGIQIFRCNSSGTAADDGTYISIKATANGSVSPLSLSAEYKAVDAGSYTTVSPAPTSGVAKVIGGGLIQTTKSYDVRITVTDGVGKTSVYNATVPGATVTYNFREGGNGLGLGTYSEGPNILNTPWDIKTTGDLTVGGNINGISETAFLAAAIALGTRGTRFPSGADLNDYKDPGAWYTSFSGETADLINTPITDSGVKLIVVPGYIAARVHHFLMSNRADVYHRYWDETSWSAWEKIGGADRVIEQGSSNGWDYKKWANGDVDLWGYFNPAVTEEGTTGSLHYSELIEIPLPFPVYPMVSGGRPYIGSMTTSYYWITSASVTNNADESHLSCRAMRATSTTITSLRMQFNIHGKYIAP